MHLIRFSSALFPQNVRALAFVSALAQTVFYCSLNSALATTQRGETSSILFSSTIQLGLVAELPWGQNWLGPRLIKGYHSHTSAYQVHREQSSSKRSSQPLRPFSSTCPAKLHEQSSSSQHVKPRQQYTHSMGPRNEAREFSFLHC